MADWRQALVAIQRADGSTVGSGFLVGDRRVLTCAHVVADAVAGDPTDSTPPAEPVLVEFAQLPGSTPISATVHAWVPIDASGGGDIAVLTLADAAPAEPVELVDAGSLWGHRFRAYGFPDGHDGGLWATGVLRDQVGGSWYQLEDVKVPGSAIESGFSGGAVFDEDTHSVVGMIVARDRAAGRKIGFMLPTGLLAARLPELATHTASVRLGGLSNVPPLSVQFVTRGDAFGRVRDALLAGESTRIAVVGMGGAGKSVLAAAVCRDEMVRAAFPDGIVWVELGPDPVVPTRQVQVVVAFGQSGNVFADAQQGKAVLTQLLSERRCLVVVDNVWAATDLGSLDVVGDRGRLLFTTRDAGIVRAVGAWRCDLGVLSPEQSRALLARWARQPVAELPPEADDIAEECGYLPLALAMAGGMIAGRPERWHSVLRRLRQADLGKIMQSFADYPYPNLLAAISVSVEALAPAERDRYVELAVFDGREPTVGAAQALWLAVGLDELDVEELLDRFADRSLIQIEADGRFTLHDLQMDYVRHEVEDVPHLHRRLLESYRTLTPAGWEHGPDDGYFHRNLPTHLAAAGWQDELRGLLSNLAWLHAKLRATTATDVIADYRLLPDGDPVTVVGAALRLGSHALTHGAGQLPAQILGRVRSESPELGELLAAARDWRDGSWLRPTAASLTPPDGPLLFSLIGHTSWVRDVVITPDDRFAVTGGWDGSVRVWDLDDAGREVHVLKGHEGGVWKVAVSADSRSAMSASADGTVRVWNLADGSERRVLRGHQGAVWSIALVPNTSLLVSGSVDTTVRIWDLDTGLETSVLRGHTGSVYTVLPSHDGNLVTSKSEDGTVRIWDMHDGCELHCLDSGNRGVQSRAMAITDRHVLSATDDGTIYVWQLSDGSLSWRLREPDSGQMWSMVVTPDGQTVIGGCSAGWVVQWRIGAGDVERRVIRSHNGWVEMLALSSDGRYVLSGADDGLLQLRAVASADLSTLRGHGGWLATAAFSSDGTRAVTGASEGALRVWQLAGGAHRELPGHQAGVDSLTVLDDRTVVSYGDDGTALSWDPRSGRAIATEPPPRPASVAADVVRMAGPLGHQEVTGDIEGTVRVRDLSEGTTVQTYRGPGGPIISLATTADGVLSGCVSGVLSAWGLDSPKPRWERQAHTSLLTGIVVVDDRVVTGGADGLVRAWRLTDGEPLDTVAELGQPIGAIAVRQDGDQLVITAAERLIILDIATGAVVATFYGDGRISALAVLSDGGIACGEAAGAVHFLTLVSG